MSTQKQFDDNNSGIISPNDFKNQPNQPDKRGRIKVAGIWYYISGWNKTNGDRSYTTLALTEMTLEQAQAVEAKQAAKRVTQTQALQQQQAPAQGQQQQARQTQAQQPAQTPTPSQELPMDFDDDIPF